MCELGEGKQHRFSGPWLDLPMYAQIEKSRFASFLNQQNFANAEASNEDCSSRASSSILTTWCIPVYDPTLPFKLQPFADSHSEL